jgi:protein-S-isoprenylcysteine O-methyltransferase
MSFNSLFIVVCAIWGLSEALLVVFKRSAASSQKRDAGSVVWLNFIIYASIGLGVFAAVNGIGRLGAAHPALPWVGLSLIVLGLAIRWVSIGTLKRFFTVDVAISADHRLLDSGIYGVIRHPSYLGSIMSFVGLGIALCNWVALLAIVIPVTGSFLRRISIEESALREAFGSQYQKYCDRTKRLVPFVY